MSYILRALKKSQQERDRGSVPKLNRAPEPVPGRERRLWPWWLAGALAVNVVAVAGGLWWFDSGSEPGKMTNGEAVAGIVSGPSEPPPAPQATAALPPAPAPAPQAAAAPPPTPVTQAVAPAPAAPALEAPTVPAPAPAAATPALAPQVAAVTPQAAPAPDPEPSPVQIPPAPPAAKPAVPATVLQVALRSDPPAAAEATPAVVMPQQDPASPEPEPDPHPYAHLPLLRQLPYEVQTAIPEMRITVHVYGEEPRSRFVMIQHKKYREGDRLSEDLILDAIAPGGLVLRYQDTAFWMDSQ